MPKNPFDDQDALFRVLINAEDQHSLWPAAIAVPDGWRIVHGDGDGTTRDSCLAYIEATWTDQRPRSLRSGDPAEVPG